MTSTADVVVVGGGHNGLICAAYLAMAGVDVVVVEQNDTPGGALRWSEWEGHLLEHGAIEHSAILNNGVIDELDLAGHGLTYRTRDAVAVHLFGDGQQIAIGPTPEATADSIAGLSPADATAWSELSARSAPLMRAMAIASTGWIPPLATLDRVATTLGGRAAAPLVELSRMSVLDLAVRWFDSSHVRAVAIFRAWLLGLPPWAPGTATALLATSVAGGQQRGRPVGGARAFVSALVEAVTSNGGVLRCGFRVGSVQRADTGWRVRSESGDDVVARKAVVSAIPPQTFMLRLLSPGDIVPRALRGRLERAEDVASNISQLTLSATLDTADCLPALGSPERDQSMLWLLDEPANAVDTYGAIAVGRVPPAPGTLVTFPTSTDPSQAPPGRATMWANAVAPCQVGRCRWDDAAAAAATAAVWSTIDRCLPGVHRHAGHAVLTTPDDLHAATGAINPGNHLAPTLGQLFGSRPAPRMGNYSTPVEGIFVTGAGTHPGGGINGASGRACAQTVLRSLSTGRVGRAARRGRQVATQLGAAVGVARQLRSTSSATPSTR